MSPAFLIDDQLLLDAGTVGSVLTAQEQQAIKHILVTHAHLDHIRAIPSLADNSITAPFRHTIQIYGIAPVIRSIRKHLFNNVIWPDFTQIPSKESPVLAFKSLVLTKKYCIEDYTVQALAVDHGVPAAGFLISKNGVRFAYTGDTGPNDHFWQNASGANALIAEVSFPDSLVSLALLTKHLTCSLLKSELAKMSQLPGKIYITHSKPQYYKEIKEEIRLLGLSNITLLHDGDVYELGSN
ncbi:3',5'-cyclic-nucleotide phosphodiesterase [Pelotalea chapellei]|uniref:3',5'-cyclic-nucleotide phosphodiesterase n=1 Tax=Pelotalea chapellei TaxID=44671 RepID=UPI001FE9A4B2|nr:3',5'-cyclic-nucleotide phosphodiesterase [Pelotalea chapellei]